MAKAIETYRGVAYPWHCDSMGHMNTQFYSALYDGASFHFLSLLAPYNELQKAGMGWADVRQLIEYKHEVPAGALLLVRTTLKRVGNKSVEYLHELRNVRNGSASFHQRAGDGAVRPEKAGGGTPGRRHSRARRGTGCRRLIR